MCKNSDAHRDLNNNLEHAWGTSSANFENSKCLALVASHGGVSAVRMQHAVLHSIGYPEASPPTNTSDPDKDGLRVKVD